MFGEKLIEARTKKDLTQEQLAEKLYVTRQAVSRWENNKTQPDLDTVGRICAILNVSPDYLIVSRKEDVNFKKLPRAQKLGLYYEFSKNIRKLTVSYCVFSIILSISLCGVIFVNTLGIIDAIHGTFGVGPLMWIGIAIGTIIFSALSFGIILYLSYLRSLLFNQWLAQKGYVRTKKFL